MMRPGAEKLAETDVKVHSDEFVVVSVAIRQWPVLLENTALSPSGNSPFLIFLDGFEVTLVLNQADFENILPGLADSRYERGFRVLTFTLEMDFSVIGFFSEVSRILAEAGISILAISSFSRDHLLVKQEHLASALSALNSAGIKLS